MIIYNSDKTLLAVPSSNINVALRRFYRVEDLVRRPADLVFRHVLIQRPDVLTQRKVFQVKLSLFKHFLGICDSLNNCVNIWEISRSQWALDLIAEGYTNKA